MSSFAMGFQKLISFTALLLILKTCRVYGQAARVEYITQPCNSQALATTVQSSPQIVIPAIIKPVSSYDSYIQETAPIVPSFGGYNDFNGYSSGYPGFLPSYPGPMPPIIVEDDDDDHWHHLLYFLIFAMRNRRNGGCGNYGGNNGGYNNNCGCGGGCNGGCGGYNSGYNGGSGCGGNCRGNCGGNCGGYYGGGYDNSCSCGGCGNNGGCSNGNNFASGYSYIPYPIPYPMNGQYSCGFPNFGSYPDNSCSCVDDCSTTNPCANEINLIIRTDQCCSC